MLFGLEEPPRGYSDLPGTKHEERKGLRDTLRELSRKTTFWMNITAATVVAFVGYGVGNFSAPFFQRTHGLNVAEVATQISVPLGLAATVGALAAGYLTERASGRYPNAVAVIPGVSLILCVPFYLVCFSSDSFSFSLSFFLFSYVLHFSFLGAHFTFFHFFSFSLSLPSAFPFFFFFFYLFLFVPFFFSLPITSLSVIPFCLSNLFSFWGVMFNFVSCWMFFCVSLPPILYGPRSKSGATSYCA